jgi:hypothetical protein
LRKSIGGGRFGTTCELLRSIDAGGNFGERRNEQDINTMAADIEMDSSPHRNWLQGNAKAVLT